MKKLLPLSILLSTLLLESVVWSQDYQKGKDAYDIHDYATALREFKPLAEQGDSRAQHSLGYMYDQGLGVPQDYKQAAQWYRRAAEQGDEQAQFNLGIMYHQGLGVPQDNKQAIQWYRRAAEQGDVGAQKNLSLMYDGSLGVPLTFLGSVIAGMKILTYWETYIAGLEYLAIFLIPMLIVGMIAVKSEDSGGSVGLGCLSMLLLPVLQVAALLVFILTLAPIIFGFAEDAAWSLPWQIITNAPGAFIKLIGVLIVSAIVLAFIPLLGQLQSFQTLVLGGVALTFVLGILDSVNPGVVMGRVHFIPSFWFSVGLIVIGGFMSWVGMMVSALIVTGVEMVEEGLGQLIMFPVAAIFGFIPLFMYGAWLGSQVRGGF